MRILVIALVLSLASTAIANPCETEPEGECVLKLKNGAETPGKTILPPGYYLDQATWAKLDAEVVRLQEAETRLTAERDVYKEGARPAWIWAMGAFVLGASTGWVLTRL